MHPAISLNLIWGADFVFAPRLHTAGPALATYTRNWRFWGIDDVHGAYNSGEVKAAAARAKRPEIKDPRSGEKLGF